MDYLIPRLYKEYGTEANFRMLPYVNDGLRPSERRVLISAYEKARDRMKKSRTISSYATGTYHNHGDCYGTIVQLVRNRELLLKQGNFGSDIGIESQPASADRYTEVMISDLAIDLCLRLKKYAPHKTAEVDEACSEPIYLPTMFPFCFIGNRPTEGIAFGYKTEVPTYKIKDLHERLLWLLGKRKEEPIIYPITESEITSDESEIKNLLITGKGKINYRGIYDIDKKNKKVHIRSFPPGRRFPVIWKKFEKEANNGDIGYQDMSSRKTGGTNVEIEVLKNRNVDKIFDNITDKLDKELRSSESFELIIVDENGKPKNISVDDFLLHCYNIYVSHTQDMLQEKVNDLNETIQEYENLKILRPVLSGYISKYNITDYKQTIKDLSNQSSLTEDVVKNLIQKYRINKLLTLDLDTSNLESERDKYNKHLKNPSRYALRDYDKLVKGL